MMLGVGQALILAWQQTSALELLAMVLALAYVILAIPQHVSCWYAAFASSALYVVVLFGARLYMEAVLNVFYAVMAVYGYWQWQGGGAARGGGGRAVVSWPVAVHARALGVIVVVAASSGFLLHRYTAAASPFIDSMITWASVFGTFLVAKKVYENWHWWLAIDSAAAVLYVTRHLYATALLFALYIVLIVVGMRQWRRALLPMREGHAAA